MVKIRLPKRKQQEGYAERLVRDPSLTRREKVELLRRKVSKVEGKTAQAYRKSIPAVKQFRRQRAGALGLVRAFGVIRGGSGVYSPYGQRTGKKGRPRGTYKYNIPIQQYKRLLAQQRAMSQAQFQQVQRELLTKGYRPEEIENLRRRNLMQQRFGTKKQISFQEFVQQNTISPNTLAMLEKLRAVQNKSKTDDLNMQRIIREKKMLNSEANLLNAKSMFGPESNTFDMWDETYNPLKAPNMFVENPNAMRILTTKRPSIMQTRETGNDLKFL